MPAPGAAHTNPQVVRGYMGADGNMVPCKRGDRVKHGAHLRLQHLETGKWLHSHSHRSPLSNNYEVSAFGKADESNTNDNWVVDAQGKQFWERGAKARGAAPGLMRDLPDLYFAVPAAGESLCTTSRPMRAHQAGAAGTGRRK